MYQHLLLPIDGSPLSDLASRHGLQLAGVLGAKATFLHVIPVFRDGATGHGVPTEDLAATYEQAAREETALLLAEAAKRAFSAGVSARGLEARSDDIHQAIIDTALAEGCDLIVMASHGRRGLSSVLLGSVTQDVLTRSKIPVLVYR